MEVYAEFKQCDRTLHYYGYEFDFFSCIDFPERGRAHFVDGKCATGTFFITPDLKFVYCFCYGIPFFYRVTNVSAKPIRRKTNKMKQLCIVTEKIAALKAYRKKLMQEEICRRLDG